MPNSISEFDSLYETVVIEARNCPVFCAIVVPGEEAFQRWPGFPAAATPQRGRVANGRGLTRDRCLEAGLGEAIELASCASWGDEALILASPDELGREALLQRELLGFSDAQAAARKEWNDRYGDFDWQPPPCPQERKIEWVIARDATGKVERAVPADFVFIGRREAGDKDAVAVADSNGCASGVTPDAAKLAALLELIERDATGRWWYGDRKASWWPLEVLGEPTLVDALNKRARRTLLFDITTDLAVPCVAAISADPDGRRVMPGFAAHPDPRRAALSAVTEMIQLECALDLVLDEAALPASWRYWLKRSSLELQVFRAAEASTPPATGMPGPEESFERILESCARLALDVYFIDMTRPEFSVPTYRALSTALCHYKPRWGRQRLSQSGNGDVRNWSPLTAGPHEILLTI